ncbi:EamA family transporter [Caulobacter sp. KR2-114]|uniref:EamA family transporter n=1 Tax=Caulobacter sp. KR2-114 TaxID=3400912 RepID=UPI003C00BA8F
MNAAIFAAVLVAAALHATWNAIVKRGGGEGGDPQAATVLVTAGAALVAAAALPFLPAPAQASWGFIAISTGLQVAYFMLVARAYQAADMSLAYPLMRGGAPLIVAPAGQLLFAEPLAPLAWGGVAMICGGVLSMAFGGPRDPRAARAARGEGRAIAIALANAVVIAAYTLVDGLGVRRSGAPAAYTLWLFLLTGIVLVVGALATRGPAFVVQARRRWPTGLAGGAGATASYGLALWAMTEAPVAKVAALRETSIVFGAAISVLVLKERPRVIRLLAACAIAAGAATLRLG